MSLCEIIRLEGYIQSIYLAVYPDQLLLLDGCCRPDVPMVLSYITTTLQRPISDLKVVMVTHMHPDHAGGAHQLRRITGCHIVAADKPRQWYHGIGGQLMHLVDTGLAHYVAKRQGRPFKRLWYPAHLHADITVQDGDHIPEFEDWQVIETSGHTDRDLSYIHSLQKVKELQPSNVMMAHGRELMIDAATFDSLIKQAPKYQRTVKDTIRHKIVWWRNKESQLG